MRRLTQAVLGKLGYKLTRRIPPDVSESELKVIRLVESYTMSSVERIIAAIRAAAYVAKNRVPGDVVECGVWKGGSSMAIARSLFDSGDTSRRICLYDTFEGMTEPSNADVDWMNIPAAAGKKAHWGYQPVTLAEVKKNLSLAGYPEERLIFVKGRVEETLPPKAPKVISILRLDTDWYESTKHELQHLYPRLASGGVLIVDDYGYYAGAGQAVDEYFAEHDPKAYLHRIDYTGAMVVEAIGGWGATG